MTALDTNLLVRLLTDDDPAQTRRVQAWLEENATPRTRAYIDHIAMCELAWVLERSYGYARADVLHALASLLEFDVLAVESPALVRRALQWYAAGPADFSDYLLAARAHAAGHAPVLTLDRKAARSATHRLLK